VNRSNRRPNLFIAILTATLAGFFGIAQAQDQPAVNSPAIFKTIVPHVNSITHLSAPAAAPAEGVEVLPPGFTQPPYIVGPVVVPTTTATEAEEHIFSDPNNYKNLLTMISDFSQNGGFNTSKFAFSSNAGTTWKESFVPLQGGFPVTADGHVWQANSDPVVAIDKLGNAYLANLYLQVNSSGNVTNDGYYVCSAKLTSGPTFTKAGCHPVRTSLTSSTVLEDKPWLSVDNSTSSFSGNVYATWTHFTATSSMIFFSRSTNHGVTWSKAIQINPAAQNGAIQGSQVAVGPKGEVYVSYELFTGTGATGNHQIAKSTNGGVLFSTPVAQTPTFNNLTFCLDYRCNSFPALAVNPKSGFIYDIYTDQPGANSKTRFVKSKTAGGLTFASPTTINDKAPGQRLMPAVSSDLSGDVNISWFDSRNSPTNPDVLDIFATYTKDNGTSFATNVQVNASHIAASAGDFIGDYSGIAFGECTVTHCPHGTPAWTSGGLNEGGKLNTALLMVP
jgi:hypothetical protein